MKNLSIEEAKSKAAHLCSQSEKAPQEIFEKLTKWEVSYADAEQIVEWLKKENFLSEARYAHAFVHDKFVYEHWGRIKIAFQLRGKGISDTLIENTLDDVISPEDYLSTLVDLLRSKMRGMSLPLVVNDRARLYRFAAQRGFESGFVAKALAVVGEDSDDLEY